MSSPVKLTDHQAKYFAHQLERSYSNDHVGKLAGLLFDAQVEPKPHQIDAALFALQTPYQPGVILADEVGLGKTIGASIVMAQFWAGANVVFSLSHRPRCVNSGSRSYGKNSCSLQKFWTISRWHPCLMLRPTGTLRS